MKDRDMFRGCKIHKEDGEWLFSDTNDPVSQTWETHPCGYCNRANTPEGIDGCLGHLPGVMNACCGHGESRLAYIQFPNGWILQGFMARWIGLAMKAIRVILKR